MKSKVIKTRQLKIIFWGIKPLSWAPINARSSSSSFYFCFTSSSSSFIYFCFCQPAAESESLILKHASLSHPSLRQLNQSALFTATEAGGTGARSDSNKVALKNSQKDLEEDATASCKQRLTKHGFGKNQRVKNPGRYMSITSTIIDVVTIIGQRPGMLAQRLS